MREPTRSAAPPIRSRSSEWALAVLAIGFAVMALVAYWSLTELRSSPLAIVVPGSLPAGRAVPTSDKRTLVRVDFAALAGWEADRLEEALAPFVATCDGARGSSDLGRRLAAAGRDLAPLCAAARALPGRDPAAVRAFFEREFAVYSVRNGVRDEGLITGYYEPELAGDRKRRGPFVHPLYLHPGDMQVVDLGEFKRDLAGRKLTGMIRQGRFRPYWDRAEIEGGALAGRGLELLWVSDPVALFFLQIQGSGRIRLPDGALVRVGYAGQNGHDYTAIGKVLVERGEMTLEEVSLQSIRAWLRAHPREAKGVLDANRSFVFFHTLPGRGAVGAAGVELTAGRSLAVDDDLLPYGLPLFLSTTLPAAPEVGRVAETPFARLLVAQDTGGAIRGPVRGDLFLGAGAEAEAIAGRMKQRGRLWLLWPQRLGEPAP